MKQLLNPFIILTTLFNGACSTHPISQPSVHENEVLLSTYVSIGANGKAMARAVTQLPSCPEILVNGVSQKMEVRFGGDDHPPFKIKICEFALPKKVQSLKIENRDVPIVKHNPKKILIIGDTGCRIKVKNKENAWIQNCNDKETWPFMKISEVAAAMHPDLVIHVGDYLYRESPCPAGVKSCEKSPSGDSWESWNADLFTPAEKLLSSAPWVFVRGNHESCARAGNGFNKLLNPAKLESSCIEEPAPYGIHFGDLSFAILDSSQKVITKERLESLKPLQLKNSILVTHRPLWGDESKETVGKVHGVKTIFAGHWHLFHLSNYQDHRATQIVVGNSGTELMKVLPKLTVGAPLDETKITEAKAISNFGFAMLEKISQHWEIREYDLNGVEQKEVRRKLR